MSLNPAGRQPAKVQVPLTGTSLFYSLMAELKRYPDGISLGRGDPDFTTPSHILEAVRGWLDAPEADLRAPGRVRSELLAAIAARLRNINGIDVDPATEIVLTQGGQEAIFLMVQTALGPGDEIIVPEPNYSSYADAIAFAGAVQVPVRTRIDENFVLDPDRVRAAVTPRTRALVMVSPNNPTAAVLSPDRVEALTAIAEEHDLIILADDIYDRFLYDGHVHTSPASLDGMKARTLTLNALSKMYAMTGWRIGWVAGPAPLIEQVARIKEAASGDLSLLSQRAGIAALTGPQDGLFEMQTAYGRRRRIVMDALDGMRLRYGVPQGGQFILADISPTGLSSLDLARRLLEEGHVLVSPGISYGDSWRGFIRMTFLQPEPVLREAMRRIADVVVRLR
ncbi:MAG: pyridoxal phosphate-dependent aminotransferase [Candidatus Methylomirabilaceae bacterium]